MADVLTTPALRVDQVSVRFGGLQALDSVDLEVAPGEVHGLIGPNGAGKTTLFNVITGLQRPTRGTVHLGDRNVTGNKPHLRSRYGLGRTFQRLELFGTLTARENVQMAAEVQRSKLAEGKTPAATTDELLDRVGILHVADEPTDALPTGLARLVEVARALATAPTMLLLDEPSSGLNAEETHGLAVVLRELADEGMGILLVEHDMELVMGLCNRVDVLDHGQVIARGTPAAVRADRSVQEAYLGGDVEPEVAAVAAAMVEDGTEVPGGLAGITGVAATPSPEGGTGADGSGAGNSAGNGAAGSTIEVGTGGTGGVAPVQGMRAAGVDGTTPAPTASTSEPEAARADGPEPRHAAGELALSVVDVRAAYGRIEVLHGVSLDVRKGSALALLGPNGAGKTTLLKAISGQLPLTGGQVEIGGQRLHKHAIERLARSGVCMIPEGRAVFPNLTVSENLLMYTFRRPGLKASWVEERAFERFPVLGTRRKQLAGTLSGGEQRMLSVARALTTEPEILLLDELSMGLAPLIVEELYEIVGQLVAQEQLTIVMVEQFVQTALSIADHAVIMVNGVLVKSGRPEEIRSEVVGAYLGAELA